LRPSRTIAAPEELMVEQADGDRLTYPTSTEIYRQGQPAREIFAVVQGLVELRIGTAQRIRYGPGDLFSYRDVLLRDSRHAGTAVALTPVELVRVERLGFLNLLHAHPTLAIALLERQHGRLREQRVSGSCCF
jgi:CRP-like cAMP-binding protein